MPGWAARVEVAGPDMAALGVSFRWGNRCGNALPFSVGSRAPIPRPLLPAIPVFKPIFAAGGAGIAPDPRPLDGPQSLCSSQIRPETDKVPFGRG